LGTAAGVATGLIPGLHVNTVAAMVLAFQGVLMSTATALFLWAAPSPEDLLLIVAALVVGNVVSHTFLDYIPSIFLGAPEGETALSVLPGHRMLLQGRGFEAIRLSAQGSLTAALLSLLLIPPFRLLMGAPVSAYDDLRPYIHLLLILVAALFMVAESGPDALRGEELVCRLPEGILKEGESPPPLQELRPSQVGSPDEAFLLKGRVVQRSQDAVVIADTGSSIRVRLRGAVDLPVSGEVSLFVAPERRAGDIGPLMQKGWALLIFLLAGSLGYIVLSTPLMSANLFVLDFLRADANSVAFLPLFTGLFGLPTLIISLTSSPRIPPQGPHQEARRLSPTARVRAALGGSLAGAIVAWIPGITAATATVLSQLFSGRRSERRGSDEEFILSISCVNTATAIFTIVALFVLLRARSGGMVAVQSIASPVILEWDAITAVPTALILFLTAAVVSAMVSFPLTHFFGGLFANLISRIPYRQVVFTVLALLLVLILLLSGIMGLLVTFVATAIGLLPPLVGVRRVHLMGSLILPLVFILA
jgi:TctA family transporter